MDAAPDTAASALKLVELLLVFGGVVAFGVWQLRDVDRARRETKRRAEEAAERDTTDPPQAPR
jgi:hypothetical protein